MLNTLKLRFSQNKSLFIAAFISLIFHTVFLTGYPTSLPSDINKLITINMRLVKAPPENKRPQEDKDKTSKNSIKQELKTPNKDEKTPGSVTPKPLLNSEDTPINQSTPSIPINKEISKESIYAAEDEGLLVEENSIEDTSIAEVNNSTNTEITQPYTYVHTEFEITRNNDLGILGTTQITFIMNPRVNTYQLTGITEAKGLAALFLSKLEQYSEGDINEKGLKPTYYAYQYGNNPEKNQYAHLLWSDGLIEMTSKKGKRSAPLPEGTQDFLSFMYQFMFTPPLNSTQITMTNGKYLRTYTYSFEGEESIATKLGDLKTLHLLKSGDSQEKTEVWLALDYRNIPVKIRKTEKNGEVLEQTVTAILTTRPE